MTEKKFPASFGELLQRARKREARAQDRAEQLRRKEAQKEDAILAEVEAAKASLQRLALDLTSGSRRLTADIVENGKVLEVTVFYFTLESWQTQQVDLSTLRIAILGLDHWGDFIEEGQTLGFQIGDKILSGEGATLDAALRKIVLPRIANDVAKAEELERIACNSKDAYVRQKESIASPVSAERRESAMTCVICGKPAPVYDQNSYNPLLYRCGRCR